MTRLPPPAKAATVARWVSEVRRSGLQGYLAQVAGILRYARAPGRVTPFEYYVYHLYDRSRSTEAERLAFIGHRGRRAIVRALNDPMAGILADDKLVTYGYLMGLGHPTPRVRALVHAFRAFGAAPTLPDAAALARYLREQASFPLFGKPLGRSNAVGVASLRGRGADGASLLLSGGRPIGIEAFAADVMSFLPRGYLFMDHLVPHPAMAALTGDRLGTVRLYLLLEEGKVRVLGALWKIACGDNMADNFHLAGNLLGALDPATGEVTRVVGGSGPDERLHEVHPDTGARLAGVRLPLWSELMALAEAAARAFPRLPYQAWDIALTPEGPVVVELNSAGDVSLWQRATGKGLMNDRFRAILARRR
jgi:hypothetical protein